MTRVVPAAVAAAFASVVVAACGGDDPESTIVDSPSDAETKLYDDPCTRASGERIKRLHITADGFRPRKLTIRGGRPVTFINCDDEPHTVTKVSGRGENFDSGTLQPRERFDKTFVTEGTHRLIDRRNPDAEMVVEVTGSNKEPQG